MRAHTVTETPTTIMITPIVRTANVSGTNRLANGPILSQPERRRMNVVPKTKKRSARNEWASGVLVAPDCRALITQYNPSALQIASMM
jgi:hypothetical protein